MVAFSLSTLVYGVAAFAVTLIVHSQSNGNGASSKLARNGPPPNCGKRGLTLHSQWAKADAEALRATHPSSSLTISYTHDYHVKQAFAGKNKEAAEPTAKVEDADAAPPRGGGLPAHATSISKVYTPRRWTADPHSSLGLATASLHVSDTFFTGDCVVLVAIPGDEEHQPDWRGLRVRIFGGWTRAACPLDASAPCPPESSVLSSHGAELVMSRVRERTKVEHAVVAEFCFAALAAVDELDVQFSGWGLTERRGLARDDVARRPGEDIAMALSLAAADVHRMPPWIAHWRALGASRIYVYLLGSLSEWAAASGDDETALTIRNMQADTGVTFVMWGQGAPDSSAIRDPRVRVGATNHAFERFRRRYLYMGFFDVNDFGVLRPELVGLGPSCDSALHLLLAWYAYLPVLALDSRLLDSDATQAHIGALVSQQRLSLPALFTSVEQERAKYEPAHRKCFVRSYGQRFNVLIGAHDVYELPENDVDKKLGGVFITGSSTETLDLRQAALASHHDALMLTRASLSQ